MTNRNECVDRRENERFQIQPGTLVMFSQHTTTLGQIVDMSMGGLAFDYVAKQGPPGGLSESDMLLRNYGVYFDHIPVETIWDAGTRPLPSSPAGMRRRGVKFRGLTHKEVSQVDSILSIEKQRITEGKGLEEATELAYAELDQIFETAADGMRVIDSNFNVLRSNHTFLSLSGTSHSEGKKCYEVFPGPLCHTPGCPLTTIIKGEERVECEIEKVRSDGSKIPCILTATPFRDISGKLIGIVEDFRDISEIKRAEKEREELITKLQQALAKVKTLSGLLPVCVSCKKIRDDKGYWNQLETYIREHSEANFTHSICPACAEKLYPGLLKKENDRSALT